MADDVWILGIKMTKFGKHPDRDAVDLAAEAATRRARRRRRHDADIGVLAVREPDAASRIGQQLQKQIGQTGIPVYNVTNACATGATALRTAIMAIKAGECDYRPRLRRREALRRRPAGRRLRAGDPDVWEPTGRFGAVAALDGRIGTETMPGVFAQIGMEYGHRTAATPSFELFARIAEKNHAHSTLNPLAAYQKRFTLEEIMGDVMIAYPNTRPMCSANCDGAAAAVVVGRRSSRRSRSSSGGGRSRSSASVLTSDPWEEACQVLPDVNTLTRTPPARRTSRPGVGPATSTWSSCTTASPPPSSCTTTTSGCASRGRGRLLRVRGDLARRVDAGQRVGRARVEGPPDRGDRASPTSGRSATHLRGEAGDRQIEGAKVGLAHVIGLGSACGVHILEKSAA